MIFSAVKKYRIFHFFTAANEAVSTILGIISFRKGLECSVLVLHYTTDVRTSNIVTDVTF